MLVLSRKALQQIRIGEDIRLTIVKVDRNQVRIGIEAPAGIPILREELVGKDRATEPDVVATGHQGKPPSNPQGIGPR